MKHSISFLLTLSITLSAALTLSDKTTKFTGCISAIDGRCLKCFKRLVRSDQDGCGSLLSSKDKCVIHSASSRRQRDCSFCEKGYYTWTNHGSEITTRCVKGFMDNCITGYYFRQISSCMICSNGLYAMKGRFAGRFVCKAAQKPTPNCLWGFRSLPNKLRCARCSEGYSVDVFTGNRVVEPQAGCWVSRDKICTTCDPYLDYSMDGEGKCFKNKPTLLIG